MAVQNIHPAVAALVATHDAVVVLSQVALKVCMAVIGVFICSFHYLFPPSTISLRDRNAIVPLIFHCDMSNPIESCLFFYRLQKKLRRDNSEALLTLMMDVYPSLNADIRHAINQVLEVHEGFPEDVEVFLQEHDIEPTSDNVNSMAVYIHQRETIDNNSIYQIALELFSMIILCHLETLDPSMAFLHFQSRGELSDLPTSQALRALQTLSTPPHDCDEKHALLVQQAVSRVLTSWPGNDADGIRGALQDKGLNISGLNPCDDELIQQTLEEYRHALPTIKVE